MKSKSGFDWATCALALGGTTMYQVLLEVSSYYRGRAAGERAAD
jgi:hypothetical protein